MLKILLMALWVDNMQNVPIKQTPNQNFLITLEQELLKINLNTYGDRLYFTLSIGDFSVTRTMICLNLVRLIKQTYISQSLGFRGNFVFFDTQGNDDPTYNFLGTRFKLIYLEESEFAQLF